jgi:SAM-dependent methyltransferase
MDQEKIWDYFQNDDVSVFADAEPRQRTLARRLARHLARKAHVLNIGIGNGALEGLLQRQSFVVSALDPSRSAVERLLNDGVDARVGVAEDLPFKDQEFDAVVASEVLEHLDDEQFPRALAHIRRVLKPGAIFIGTVPFSERLVDGVTICPSCGHRYHRWGHQRSFTKAGLAEALQQCFVGERIEVRSFVVWGGGARRNIKSAFKWILGRLGEPIASPHLVFETRRERFRSASDAPSGVQ